MTKKFDIQTQLNQILLESLTSKTAYKQGFQKWLDLFIANYETALNKNSLPLLDFFKKLDEVEKIKIREYLFKATSLKALKVSDKGIKLVFKDSYDSLVLIDSALKWYDIKIEVKPFEPSQEKLKKSLENLLKHYDKEDIKNTLNTL